MGHHRPPSRSRARPRRRSPRRPRRHCRHRRAPPRRRRPRDCPHPTQARTLAAAHSSPMIALVADPAGHQQAARAYWLLTQHTVHPRTVLLPGRRPCQPPHRARPGRPPRRTGRPAASGRHTSRPLHCIRSRPRAASASGCGHRRAIHRALDGARPPLPQVATPRGPPVGRRRRSHTLDHDPARAAELAAREWASGAMRSVPKAALGAP